jgi:branched-chain amino acid aminotransferase
MTRQIWTWFEGGWHEGNIPIMGVSDHGTWLGSLVFDGARAFDGYMPDLALHCARVNASARGMGLNPTVSDEEIHGLALEGVKKFPVGTALYIRPMIWAKTGSAMMVSPDPDSATFALCLEERPMAKPEGLSFTTTRFRRPTPDTATTNAKAGCLYPNNARMLAEANAKGFQNAISQDVLGNVAETATSNVFMVKDGVVLTPIPSGCFLDGITRQRVIGLLRDDGVEVVEKTLVLDDFRDADEIFTSGNAMKVMHATQFEDRHLQYGRISRRARELYWDYAASV